MLKIRDKDGKLRYVWKDEDEDGPQPVDKELKITPAAKPDDEEETQEKKDAN